MAVIFLGWLQIACPGCFFFSFLLAFFFLLSCSHMSQWPLWTIHHVVFYVKLEFPGSVCSFPPPPHTHPNATAEMQSVMSVICLCHRGGKDLGLTMPINRVGYPNFNYMASYYKQYGRTEKAKQTCPFP